MPLEAPIYKNVIRYTGESDVPNDIRRRRELSMETMRRLGTPVLIKHRYNIDDVSNEVAFEVFDTTYKQPEHEDPLSWGIGYASLESIPGEWYDEEGELHISKTGKAGWSPAPLYRGYGPGYLTYCILPDTPEDIWKISPTGALLHTQQARVQLPWWPYAGDNDLLITVQLDNQEKIISTLDRYDLAEVTPITMRGLNRLGEREFHNAGGNRFHVGQYCEAIRIPENQPQYRVESDR